MALLGDALISNPCTLMTSPQQLAVVCFAAHSLVMLSWVKFLVKSLCNGQEVCTRDQHSVAASLHLNRTIIKLM